LNHLVELDESRRGGLDGQILEETGGVDAVLADHEVHQHEGEREVLEHLARASKLDDASGFLQDKSDLAAGEADQLVVVPGAELVDRSREIGKLRWLATSRGNQLQGDLQHRGW